MYEDLIKDLEKSNDDNKLTFDFISEDEDEDKLGEESKNFIKNFDLTLKEQSAFLTRNQKKSPPIVMIDESDNSDDSDLLLDKEKQL
jgi:hypothetical protein